MIRTDCRPAPVTGMLGGCLLADLTEAGDAHAKPMGRWTLEGAFDPRAISEPGWGEPESDTRTGKDNGFNYGAAVKLYRLCPRTNAPVGPRFALRQEGTANPPVRVNWIHSVVLISESIGVAPRYRRHIRRTGSADGSHGHDLPDARAARDRCAVRTHGICHVVPGKRSVRGVGHLPWGISPIPRSSSVGRRPPAEWTVGCLAGSSTPRDAGGHVPSGGGTRTRCRP